MRFVSRKLPLAVAALSIALLSGCACGPEAAPAAEPAAAPAAEPAPAPAPAPAPETITLSGDALFDFDKSNLRPDAVEALDTTVQKYKGASLKSMSIVGHTDSSGSDAINNPLSVNRAASTRDYLSSRGVSMGRMSIDGRGAREPIAGNETPEGRARNRRVEIFVAEPDTAVR